ncbi:MAG: hypothetical protein JSR86_05830 [Proteobacteria bacterium]|nr:hypothetical protein [Pseudomonadota bacterium]
MPFTIQFYGPPIAGEMPHMECVEMGEADLATAQAFAISSIAPNERYEWAQAYEIMAGDFEIDPCVASWSKTGGDNRHTPPKA